MAYGTVNVGYPMTGYYTKSETEQVINKILIAGCATAELATADGNVITTNDGKKLVAYRELK